MTILKTLKFYLQTLRMKTRNTKYYYNYVSGVTGRFITKQEFESDKKLHTRRKILRKNK